MTYVQDNVNKEANKQMQKTDHKFAGEGLKHLVNYFEVLIEIDQQEKSTPTTP